MSLYCLSPFGLQEKGAFNLIFEGGGLKHAIADLVLLPSRFLISKLLFWFWFLEGSGWRVRVSKVRLTGILTGILLSGFWCVFCCKGGG